MHIKALAFMALCAPMDPAHMEAIGVKRTQMFLKISENHLQARVQTQAGHTTKEMHFP